MAIYYLEEDAEPGFPDPNVANEDGILATGGKLSIDWLLTAYGLGIFPWFNEEDPILWWSPDPRLILLPQEFKLSKSLKRVIKKKQFVVKLDHQFTEVIEACSKAPRGDQEGTWLTNEMKEAYIKLHERGVAHSVEVYEQDELVGGLYGVSLGKYFCGESMFFKKRDASKVALYYLCQELSKWGFHFIDGQVETAHLISLGAQNVARQDFLSILEEALTHPTCLGKWTKTIRDEF